MTTVGAQPRNPPEAGEPKRPRRRWVRRLLVLVLVLLLLFLAAAWYFASQINADALAVKDYPPSTATVSAVDDSTVTLDDSAARREPLHADLRYGLSWATGFGEISGPVTESDGAVQRAFVVLRGSAPAVGETVELVRSLVDDAAPDALVATEEISFPSGRGDLPALFADGDATTWAILVHGKGATPAEMMRMAQGTVQAQMPTLAINYRNDDGTPADPSGRYGYGQTEWHDLEAAVAYAVESGAEHVVLGGASMGGGIVAAYLENADLEPGLVVGVVLDAPMLDLGATIDYGAEQLDLPLGLSVPAPLGWAAKAIAAVQYDVDWAATDYVDDTGWLTVPALVFHTDGDLTVPITTTQEFATEEPELVQFAEFDGGHVEAYNDDPDRYLADLSGFLASLEGSG